MNGVFLDTVGLLALWDIRDQWHAAAENAFAHLFRSKKRVYSTELIFAECANAASRSPFRSDVAQMRNTLLLAGGILQPTEPEVAAAWVQFARDGLGKPGIVDLLSCAVMHRLDLQEAFTNDRHFKAAGFTTLF